jgi:hypothetical protein
MDANRCRRMWRVNHKRTGQMSNALDNTLDKVGGITPNRLGSYGRSDLVPDHKRPLPVPTKALPGTPAKIKVLVERYAAGYELWHRLDAGMSESCDGHDDNADKIRRLLRGLIDE